MQEYFQQLNQYYDKIYVLSVAPAVERRELFAKRFNGLEFSFFYGADKNNFTVEESIKKNIYNKDLTQKHHRYSKTMKHGEIACAWRETINRQAAIRTVLMQLLHASGSASRTETPPPIIFAAYRFQSPEQSPPKMA